MRNKWEKVKAKVKLVLMVDDDNDQAPSEQDIEDALKILVSRKPELLEDSEGYNRTFRELRNELVPKIDEGITLTDQNSAWKPWLSDMQSSDTWETPRSDSYYQYLVMDKNSSYSTLDYTANEIVKLLADPRRDQPAVSRKGLILGDVQSGKTRTYIALMNKAADCRYRLIIVLTSDNILLVRYSACSMSSLNSLRPPTIIRFSFSVEEIKHFFGSNQEVIVYVMSKIQSVNTRQSR